MVAVDEAAAAVVLAVVLAVAAVVSATAVGWRRWRWMVVAMAAAQCGGLCFGGCVVVLSGPTRSEEDRLDTVF